MPGTIQVSVSGLSDVQTSSGSSDTSIKVSMGKTEYQTSDSGDYSFPVTTLRDKLTVTLVDANGNDVSRRENRLIIERGFLEEKLQIEGRGNVLLKLQFVLSEEDRDRIRFLRQSALRKKHEELVYGNASKPKFIASDPRKMAADEHVNPERNKCLSQETEFKSNADGEPVTSTPVSLRRSSSDVFAIKESSEVIKSETVSFVKENSCLDKLETGKKPKAMRRSMSERNLTNVKKMITAFETGLTQDKKIGATQKTMYTENDHQCNDLLRHTKDEKTMVSMDKNLEEQPRRSNSLSKQRRKRSSVAEGREEKQIKFTCTEDFRQYNIRGSRLWIFPDGAKDSCTTASGTRHFDSPGANGVRANTDSCVRENTSENPLQKGFNGGSYAKTNYKWKNIQRSKKPKPETSEDSERSRGPVGQVMRALIMVGFASLVLLTRQRKN
ncbi:PREDICTED: uncharacterized protein LOC104817752 isoform X2 [Tarenaya hassleriana]|uniref:uncharacterized protein LOC104817752 isoform X2 n=1 Tax=Tarenaya hassleriana TaxID=28532 RepID=UPI00053CA672|nr:PREDICTED: uncharacterized protein LOC104817752 isoform X2 [Tarenaya hassleriana]